MNTARYATRSEKGRKTTGPLKSTSTIKGDRIMASEPADDFENWDDGLRCPACGSDMIYKDRIVPPGRPPHYCDDCGEEGEEEHFRRHVQGGHEKPDCSSCQCAPCGIRASMVGEVEPTGCLYCLIACSGVPKTDCKVGDKLPPLPPGRKPYSDFDADI